MKHFSHENQGTRHLKLSWSLHKRYQNAIRFYRKCNLLALWGGGGGRVMNPTVEHGISSCPHCDGQLLSGPKDTAGNSFENSEFLQRKRGKEGVTLLMATRSRVSRVRDQNIEARE